MCLALGGILGSSSILRYTVTVRNYAMQQSKLGQFLKKLVLIYQK